MKRGLYVLMIVWLLAAGVCGVIYQVRGGAKSNLLTPEEADAMVRAAKEETRREVLAEIDAKEAAQTPSEDTWVTTTAGQKADSETKTEDEDFAWEEDGTAVEDAETEAADTEAEAADDKTMDDAFADETAAEETSSENADAESADTAAAENTAAAETAENEASDGADLFTPEEWALILASLEEQGPYYRVTVTEAEKVWLRSEPLPDSGQIKTVTKGTQGYLIEDGEGWALIWIDNQIGYMGKPYLSREEIPAEEYPHELREVTAEDAGDVLYLGAEG